MVSLPLLFTPSSSPADGGAAKISPLSPLFTVFPQVPLSWSYSTPLSLLCNSSLDASDYRGELRLTRPLAGARGAQVRRYSPELPRLLFQMFLRHTLPQLLPEVCLQHTPRTRRPPPLNCRCELSQRTLQPLSVIPQTGETSSLSVLTREKSHLAMRTLHTLLQSLRWRRHGNRGIGGPTNYKRQLSVLSSKNVVPILPVLWAQGYCSSKHCLLNKHLLLLKIR